jgi:type III secretory pathway component EscR
VKTAVEIGLLVVLGYAVVGGVVGLVLLTIGIRRLPHGLAASPRRVRPLLWFGFVALWPLVLLRLSTTALEPHP